MWLRTGDWLYLISSRIQCPCNSFDIAAFAGRIPSLIGNDHRNPLTVQAIMQFSQFGLQLLQFLLVLFFVNCLAFQLYVFQLRHLDQWKNILKDRYRMTLVLQCHFNTADQCIHHLQLCPLLILCINDIPRRTGHIGVFHITVKYILALLIMFVLPFIESCHTPLGIILGKQLLHTFFLFVLINLHKEFQDQISIVRKLPFKTPDALDTPLISISFEFSIQYFLHRLFHPSGIQECKFAFFRDLFHITIQKRSAYLFLCRS